MTDSRHLRNLALIGFMGSGKSSVGRLVAEMLQFDFIDTDELIESRTGQPISEFFAGHGEARFRALEFELLEELAGASRTVIATGGGFVLNPSVFESLRPHALIVCLWASPDVIWSRVRHQTHRPLLQTPNPIETIAELLKARLPFYRRADVLVGTDLRSLRHVAQQVVHQSRSAFPSLT